MSLDLSTLAGFPLSLDGEQLTFGSDILIAETRSRTRAELAPVARDPAACVPPDAVQYWMFNGIAARADAAQIEKVSVRYELTLILPHALGAEKSKTLGHIHNALAAGSPTFSEIFEVLYGVAHFLFWTLDAAKTRAPFCAYFNAPTGTRLICPPDLYHLTINAGDTPLLFADLISTRAFGIYDDVKSTHGGPYYELTDHPWVPNPNFIERAPLTSFAPALLDPSKPLYTEFAAAPVAFNWLDDPH